MKEKTRVVPNLVPKAPPADRAAPSRRAGIVLAVAGVLLMILSGWTPSFGSTAGVSAASGFSSGDAPGSFVFGGSGGDDVYGEPGVGEVIVAREGDDFIEAKDGVEDRVICGSGDDVASVDEFDVAAPDCETVYGG